MIRSALGIAMLWLSGAGIVAPVTLTAASLPTQKLPDIAPGFALAKMERISDNVYVGRLSSHLWVHSTVGKLDDGTLYLANGMLLESGDSSILFDAGWTPEEAETLVKWAQTALKHPVAKAYITHFHSDRLGGAAALEKMHIPVFATTATIELAKTTTHALPDHPLAVPSQPTLVAPDAVVFFPGAGHTRDNIVAYFPDEHVIFGGCFIKAANAESIGNIADADLIAWPASIEQMQHAFPEAGTVIPGHGPIGVGGDAVGKTLQLLSHPDTH